MRGIGLSVPIHNGPRVNKSAGDVLVASNEAPVLSYNQIKKCFEITQILSKYVYNKVDSRHDLWYLKTSSVDPGCQFGCAILGSDSMVLSENEFVPASSLKPGDNVTSSYQSIINRSLKVFLEGLFMGKASLATKGSRACIVVHNTRNKKMQRWIVDRLESSRMFTFSEQGNGDYRSNYRFDLQIYKESNPIYRWPNSDSSWGMAMFYASYGSLLDNKIIFDLSNRFSTSDSVRLITIMMNESGIACRDSNMIITLSVGATKMYFERYAKYLPSQAHFKIPSEHRVFDQKKKTWSTRHDKRFFKTEVVVVESRPGSSRQYRDNKVLLGFSTNNGNLVIGGGAGFIVNC